VDLNLRKLFGQEFNVNLMFVRLKILREMKEFCILFEARIETLYITCLNFSLQSLKLCTEIQF
jgi:hypothetical protein